MLLKNIVLPSSTRSTPLVREQHDNCHYQCLTWRIQLSPPTYRRCTTYLRFPPTRSRLSSLSSPISPTSSSPSCCQLRSTGCFHFSSTSSMSWTSGHNTDCTLPPRSSRETTSRGTKWHATLLSSNSSRQWWEQWLE